MSPRIAIVYVRVSFSQSYSLFYLPKLLKHGNELTNLNQYSMYGHVRTLAEAEKKGIENAGGTADLYQIRETLSEDVLAKMHAPPKDPEVPVLDNPELLAEYDAFLFGIPTRFGNMPAQWKVFTVTWSLQVTSSLTPIF